jgi:hypothetical protein
LFDYRLGLLALIRGLGQHGACHRFQLELAPFRGRQRFGCPCRLGFALGTHPHPLAVAQAAPSGGSLPHRVGLGLALNGGTNLGVGEYQLGPQIVGGPVVAPAGISSHQSVLQYAHRKALLSQQGCSSDAALSGVAAHYIGYLSIELTATPPDIGKRYVQAAGQSIVTVLVGQAYVQPLRSPADKIPGLAPAHLI